jgi:mycothiol synthase
MSRHDQIDSFVETLAEHDGFAPFSDEKLPSLRSHESSVLVAEDGDIVGIGVVATHPQSDGSVHTSLETAVLPAMRFPAFEGAVLDASLLLIPAPAPLGVWSNRTTLDTALAGRGFTAMRVLDYLAVDLPLNSVWRSRGRSNPIRAFESSDVDQIVSMNNAAFVDHKEASSLSAERMREYMVADWFDADGLFVANSGIGVGFCWTRVHDNGDGEIFRIAVRPQYQGTGVGFDLLRAGFEYLASRIDVRRGVLWVDRSNLGAVDLYRSIGMELQRSNTEFGRQ